VERVVAELRARPGIPCRPHPIGDLYDQKYIKKWIAIARQCPETQFWCYTRSRRIPELLPALVELASLPNFHLWFSLDRDAPVPPHVPGVRGVWLQADQEEPSGPSEVQLVFREVRDESGRPRDKAQKKVAGVQVCPYELLPDGAITCAKCKICFNRKQ
jgi:Gene product 88